LPTSIQNLLTKPLHSIPDHRGKFLKLFLNNTFVEEDISISYRNVLRGIHYQTEGSRIFTPIYGRAYVVFLDLQENSPTRYDNWSLTIDDSNRQSFVIPPYVGCGFLVLSDLVMVHYKWEFKYDQSHQRTICYDDENFNIYWPLSVDPILSERDFYADESLIR
jgi:dTDP-4-dehydrorhamnose 3,5-epimerase